MFCSEAQLTRNLQWPGTGINGERLRAHNRNKDRNCKSLEYRPEQFALVVTAAKTGEVRIVPLSQVIFVEPEREEGDAKAKRGKASDGQG
jgi:hypothetical protein